MKIFFKPSFVKDLRKLPVEIKAEVENICFSVFPKANNLFSLRNLSIQKMQGYGDYYRCRIGDYRLGFKKNNSAIIFMRVLHRKNIYRFFP